MDRVLRGSLNQIRGVLAGVLVERAQRLEGGMLVLAKSAKRVTARSYYMPGARGYISLFLSWCFCLSHSTLHPICSLFGL